MKNIFGYRNKRSVMKSGKKIIKILLFVVILVPVLFLIFNYFLAYRLESYLKGELADRVSVATNHFYVLSFDGLSINLLNGELRIEGIELRPDSDVFNQWKSLDSLPETYLKAKIDVIDFEGVNLIWRWSYKRLNFNTFEIQSPVLEVYASSDSFQADSVEEAKKTKIKPLYELMEPYINVLTVGALNLEHAIISYNVENSLGPIVYKLDDVSFHAYGFRLDSLSYDNGKLLYSDNFDFITNKHQTLLANNEFLLLTDSIRLSTQDSIIYLENIHLIPQEELWNETNKKPSNYVDGQIRNVKVDGIFFTRKKSLNYLEAKLFGIYSPDIKVYNLEPGDKSKKDAPVVKTDSLMQALSLYDLISPILHSVAIDQISLENTTADYFSAFNDSIETYHLDNFDFHAYDFLVDSLSETENKFWYSRDFAFEAKGLEAMLKARNHKISVGRVSLDTEKKLFSIENIRFHPISTQTLNDYMDGMIKYLNVSGLTYDSGISADLFDIENPVIKYVQAPRKKEDADQVDDNNKSQVDIRLLLNPLLDYLSIRKIRINGANASFTDRNENDTIIYKINNFDFYATDFLINEKTIGRKNKLFFDYKEFGFDFRNFDNYILDKDYRVTINNAVFSSIDGLRLEHVELIPRKTSEMYVSLKAPLIELLQPAWALSMDNFLLKMRSVSLDRFNMKNAEVGFNYKSIQLNQKVDVELEGLHYDNGKQLFEAKNIYFNTKNINVALDNNFYNLHVGDLLFDHHALKLEDIKLESPYPKEEFALKHPKHSDWMEVSVGSFSLNDIDLPSLVKNKMLTAGSATADNVVLGIYKNKQISVPQKFKPMIYEGIQKAPLKMNINSVKVRNMSLVYEELSLKGTQPGKLFFTEINGVFNDFTNVAKRSDQYIHLKANAKFMNDGYLTADWRIPVDSLNDSFLLDAHMSKFNFATLNAMITPAAPVSIKSGKVNDLTFSIKGTSLLSDIHMKLLYDSLKVEFLKEKEGEFVERNMLSDLANMVVRDSNPRHKDGKPHVVDVSAIERDQFRSTFSYIWTILRPAMADAVGISQTEQHVAEDAVDLMKKIKSFFYHEKKEDVEQQKE